MAELQQRLLTEVMLATLGSRFMENLSKGMREGFFFFFFSDDLRAEK